MKKHTRCKDIQSQTDLRNIPIDKVGVKHIKYPIVVEDRTNKVQHTIADIDIFVDLPHNHRGTHMSRFVEVLNSYHQETLIDNLQPLLKKVKVKLNSERAYITIRFPYFIKKIAPVSKIASYLDYECVFEASLGYYNLGFGNTDFHFTLGVTVPITTLCPCSKEISDYGAHNQRSLVTVKVRYHEFIWIEEIIELVEKAASCEIYPLLKRPDEKFVTEYAYDHPAFVEDIVRDIAVALQKDKRIDWYSVASENMESIHNHSAYAYIASGV